MKQDGVILFIPLPRCPRRNWPQMTNQGDMVPCPLYPSFTNVADALYLIPEL
jgi:hypothetical protein